MRLEIHIPKKRYQFTLFILLFSTGLFAQSIYGVATAIPVFIGYTEKAIDETGNILTGSPRKIYSLTDYRQYFGMEDSPYHKKILLDENNKIVKTVTSPFVLYPSVLHYFANGGGGCYIVSVGNYLSPVNKADFYRGLDSAWKLNGPTLLLFPDAVNLPGKDLYEVQKAALRQAGTLGDRFCILDLRYADSKPTHEATINEFRESIGEEYLGFGAAYSPHLKIVPKKNISYRNWKDALYKNNSSIQLRDLTTNTTILTKIDELETAINNHDPQAMNLEHNLSYLFPLIEKISQQLNQSVTIIPPSGAVAGIYCKTDEERGVWKSPSGIYSIINSVLKSEYTITKEDENKLTGGNTGKFINPIRYFPGSGFTIWGGRTLSTDIEWRYIPTRRFINYVDESITVSLNQGGFTNNTNKTWTDLKTRIGSFLLNLWRLGALQGVKPEQAYFVRVGLGETMTLQDIEERKLIVETGISFLRPGEFIIRRYFFTLPVTQ